MHTQGMLLPNLSRRRPVTRQCKGAAMCEMAVLMPLYIAFILGVLHLREVGYLEQAVTFEAHYGAWSSEGGAKVGFDVQRLERAAQSTGASLDGDDALLLQHLLDGPEGKGAFFLESKVASTLGGGILKHVHLSTAHQTNLPGPLLRVGRGRAGRRAGLEDPTIRMKIHFDEAERLILKTPPPGGKQTPDFLIPHPAWSSGYKPDRGKIPRPY